MKTAIFLPSLAAGGAQRSMLLVASGLADRGHEVALITMRRGGELESEVPPRVRRIDFDGSRTRWAFFPIARWLRRERPACAMTAMDHANLALVLGRHLSRTDVRTIVTYRSSVSAAASMGDDLGTRARPLIAKLVMRMADHVVAISEGVATDLIGIWPPAERRISVIYNPTVRPDLFRLSEEEVMLDWFDDGLPVVLAVGRLSEEKGLDVLLEAFALVSEQRPETRLLILGEGPSRGRLEQLAAYLDLEEKVKFPGFVANPYPYMRRCRTFVLSSRREGLGNVLVEAGVLGAPLVATDCPTGPREILSGRQGAELVPPEDADSLASAIVRALDRRRRPIEVEPWSEHTLRASVDKYEQVLSGDVGSPRYPGT